MCHIGKLASHIVAPIAKPLGKLINAIPGGQYLADAVAIGTGNPEFIPAINGLSTYGKTGNLGSSLLSAGGSYLGAQLGSSLLGNTFPGTIGSAFGDTASNAIGDQAGTYFGDAAGAATGSTLGTTAGNSVGTTLGNYLGNDVGDFAGNAVSNLSNTSLSSAIGGTIGSSLGAGNAGGGANTGSVGTSSFTPSQQAQGVLPSSLSAFGGLDQNQQASNIANQGVYGGGLGPDEQSYFTNLVNRQLVDNSGHVNDLSSLSPIENSYLQNLGLGGYGNSNDLLQAISKWKTAA